MLREKQWYKLSFAGQNENNYHNLMFDFLRILIRFFDQNNIPYMLSGSVAMSVYALPRFTQDFDFVVHLRAKDAKILAVF